MSGHSLPPGLKELLDELAKYSPALPDEVTQYIMRRSGYDCKDERMLRMVSVGAQRFVAQVLEEAYNAQKLRQAMPAAKLKEQGYDPKDKRDVLTAEDLTKAMQECGVKNADRPLYLNTTKPQ